MKEKGTEKESVYVTEISTFAPKSVRFSQDQWARVDGTFLKGPAGHFGMWPGELVRVTGFDVIPKL